MGAVRESHSQHTTVAFEQSYFFLLICCCKSAVVKSAAYSGCLRQTQAAAADSSSSNGGLHCQASTATAAAATKTLARPVSRPVVARHPVPQLLQLLQPSQQQQPRSVC